MSNCHQWFLHLHHQNELLILAHCLRRRIGAHGAGICCLSDGVSSAALAPSCGQADTGLLSVQTLLRRVTRSTALPVTVDIEGGVSDPDLSFAKIAPVRQALRSRPMFINARKDVHLRGMAEAKWLHSYARA